MTPAFLVAATVLTMSDSLEVPLAPDGVLLNQVERAVVVRTNQQRERYGLRPLKVSAWLQKSARRHCAWMTNSRSLQHTSAGVAENIAMGQINSSHAVRDWMNSPGHRANMLNGSYTKVGAAAYQTPGGTIYWCLQFTR